MKAPIYQFLEKTYFLSDFFEDIHGARLTIPVCIGGLNDACELIETALHTENTRIYVRVTSGIFDIVVMTEHKNVTRYFDDEFIDPTARSANFTDLQMNIGGTTHYITKVHIEAEQHDGIISLEGQITIPPNFQVQESQEIFMLNIYDSNPSKWNPFNQTKWSPLFGDAKLIDFKWLELTKEQTLTFKATLKK